MLLDYNALHSSTGRRFQHGAIPYQGPQYFYIPTLLLGLALDKDNLPTHMTFSFPPYGAQFSGMAVQEK